jgi:hypothetical protein
MYPVGVTKLKVVPALVPVTIVIKQEYQGDAFFVKRKKKFKGVPVPNCVPVHYQDRLTGM